MKKTYEKPAVMRKASLQSITSQEVPTTPTSMGKMRVRGVDITDS